MQDNASEHRSNNTAKIKPRSSNTTATKFTKIKQNEVKSKRGSVLGRRITPDKRYRKGDHKIKYDSRKVKQSRGYQKSKRIQARARLRPEHSRKVKP
jgi:hypothetical protein